MFKRIFWWAVGATMGAAGSQLAQRKLKRKVAQTIGRYTPPVVADRMVTGAKIRTLTVVDGVRNALETGKHEAMSREDELRHRFATGPRSNRK